VVESVRLPDQGVILVVRDSTVTPLTVLVAGEFDRLSAVQFPPNHCARGTWFKIYGRISMPLDFG